MVIFHPAVQKRQLIIEKELYKFPESKPSRLAGS